MNKLSNLAEDTSRSGAAVNGNEVSPNELYSQSAIYIAAAHGLKPNYSVYYKVEESLEESINVNVVDNDEKDIANVVVDSDEKFEAPTLVEDNDVGPILLKGLEAEAIGEENISDQTTETIFG